MAALHFGAALLVMVAYLATSDSDFEDLRWIPVGILPVLLGGALPPYLVAVITWWLATAWGRGPVREVLAVAVGALIGTLVPLFFMRAMLLPAVAITVMAGSIAVCSALGFAIWVLVAWRPRCADAEQSKQPLN